MAKVADAVEGGAHGVFRFTRANDDLSQDLTVHYTIDQTAPDAATWGGDYFGVTGTTDFDPGEATSDVTIWAWADNEFEDMEKVVLTLVGPPPEAPPYQISGELTQVATITDNAPQVSASAVWYSMSGPTIGQITLTRSGGDTMQPLTVWFEPDGTLVDDGETLNLTMAATAEFPANVTTLVIPIMSFPMMGGIANVQMPGATPKGPRADQTAALNFMLFGLPGSGFAFAEAIDPKKLGNPLSYAEYQLLKSVSLGQVASGRFGSPADEVAAILTATNRVTTARIDWRTVPEAKAANAAGRAVGFAAVLAAAGWSQTALKLSGLIADLADNDFQTRDKAEADIKAMMLTALSRGDLTRVMLIHDRVVAANRDTTDIETRNSTKSILYAVEGQRGIQMYRDFKLRAAAAVAGTTVYSIP